MTVSSGTSAVPPNTPVLVGVGQLTERLADPGYRAMSPVQLAAAAVRLAVEDAGSDLDLVARIDVFAGTRQFENSKADSVAPLGRSNNFPRAVADAVDGQPKRVMLSTTGGQSPQQLIGCLGDEIAAGRSRVAVAFGAEALSTVRHLVSSGTKDLRFTQSVDPAVEDAGFGLDGMVSRHLRLHGLSTAPTQYALIENARRFRLGLSRAEHVAAMAQLLAPMSRRAAENPLAADRTCRSAAQLASETSDNRRIADPYLRRMVARDQVNQSAAVVMMSTEAADEIGIPQSRRVYLHGRADVRDQPLLHRTDLSRAPASVLAFQQALTAAGITVDDVTAFDLYSCFPAPVHMVCDGLGITPDDPRPLTLTGGLPFFGGPGNNYSMHAIAEAVIRCRHEPAARAAVGANGGIMNKYSVGVYGAAPRAWQQDASRGAQETIDAMEPAPVNRFPSGWGSIETFTIRHDGAGPGSGIVIGRLETTGERFVALTTDGDDAALDLLAQEQPIGSRIFVRSHPTGNRFTIDQATMERLWPVPLPRWDRSFDHLQVTRDGHVLTITINRPQRRNALHPPAHAELAEAFDAYFADPDLRVAIITGSGTEAFCAGNDLTHAAAQPSAMPATGFAGITSRREMRKPVIAAVNGYALGGGFEIALAAHLVVADESATFALPEVRIGLVAGAGGLVRLPQALPPKLAHELILTGRSIRADEALSHGLINQVAPAGQALRAATDLAQQILASSPTAVRAALTMMDRATALGDTIDAIADGVGVVDDLLATQDFHEGVTSFAQKRAPKWVNR